MAWELDEVEADWVAAEVEATGGAGRANCSLELDGTNKKNTRYNTINFSDVIQ